MPKSQHFWKASLCVITMLFSITSLKAQLKIGSNPSTINKSSILELESDRQGLLLTRLADTSLINAITPAPPAGMIIYLSKTPNSGLYLRTAGNYWQQISGVGQDSTYWRITGNGGTDSTKDFLGTTNAQALSIRANNIEAIHITQNGDLKLPNVQTTTDSLQVLVIDPTNGNIVKRRSLSTAAFENAIRYLGGLKNEGITLNADSSATSSAFGFTSNATDSTISLNVPLVNATTKTAGFLSYTDYARFDSAAKAAAVNWTAAFNHTTPNAVGMDISNSTHTITLHAASATSPGIVSDSTQAFGGNKTFSDSLTASKTLVVGTSSAGTSTFQVNGSLATNITTVTSSYTVLNTDNTILADATAAAISITLPSPTSIAGRIYTIKKVGSGGIDKAVTITPISGTIDGGSSYIIYNDWSFVTLQTDGTNWYIIKK